MPVILDIRKDIRYLQGAEETNKQNALKMLEKGASYAFIQEITGLTLEQLQKLQEKIKA